MGEAPQRRPLGNGNSGLVPPDRGDHRDHWEELPPQGSGEALDSACLCRKGMMVPQLQGGIMEGCAERHRVLFSCPRTAIALIIAGLMWIIGCKQDVPTPKGAAGVGGCLVNDVLWAQTAFSDGELHFLVCYDAKHTGIGGSKGGSKPDGSQESSVYVVSKDGFTLDLKYASTKPAIEI